MRQPAEQTPDLAAARAVLPWRVPFDPPSFDFGAIPPGAGVFLLETKGEPFLGKSASLRRRLARLLGPREASEPPAAQKPPRPARARLNLRDTTVAIHYRSTGSVFETSLLLYQAARAVFPSRYCALLRLRVPPLLKVNLRNEYPRCYVTRRLARVPAPAARPARSGSESGALESAGQAGSPGAVRSLWYGPFPDREAAEKFSAGFLDLFLVRRCTETIHPDPAHPGCIYGEMKMCLRPCQAKCTKDEYRAETDRLAAFLSSDGLSLIREVEGQREGASGQLEFEEASRLHKRLEKVHEAVRQRPGLARDLESLHGLVIQRATGGAAVELFPVWRGFLLPRVTFTFAVVEGKPVSMDARLRELLSGLPAAGPAPLRAASARMRGDHLALLARWYYRGTRQGEFVDFDSYEKLPFRRIVNAINRVARQGELRD